MKIKSETVISFFQSARLILHSVKDTIRSGDDGFEGNCIDQIDSLMREMDIFTVEHLTPLTPVKSKPSPAYISIAEAAMERGGDTSIAENIAVYKTRLYNFIKAGLSGIVNLDAVKNDGLAMAIEGCIICGSRYEREYYSKEWFYTSMAVIADVANEIIAHRAANPQVSLF